MNIKHFPFCLLVIYSIFATVPLGCSGDNQRPPLAAVSGTVNFNGQPVVEGKIIFESSGKRPATIIVKNGQIVEATTFETNDGVPVGEHRLAVYVTSTGNESSTTGTDPGEKKEFSENYMGGGSAQLPAKYSNPATSGLTASVTKEGPNEIQLELTQ